MEELEDDAMKKIRGKGVEEREVIGARRAVESGRQCAQRSGQSLGNAARLGVENMRRANKF